LPRRTLADGTISTLRIVPFYDRSELIYETLGTLKSALSREIIITILVVLIMMVHLRSALIISGLLPLAVLVTFIAMKIFRVDANIVALSGIAIAIGTMVDMGIIITENIRTHLKAADPAEDRSAVVQRAAREVGGAMITAVATTIVSFLPVFTMVAAEGKLFKPLAFTKTFALLASLMVALCIIPPLARSLLSARAQQRRYGWMVHEGLIYGGGFLAVLIDFKLGLLVALAGVYNLLDLWLPAPYRRWLRPGSTVLVGVVLAFILAQYWLPLGVERGLLRNFIFVVLIMGGVLSGLKLFHRYYVTILSWCLAHKTLFLTVPMVTVFLGALIWLGFFRIFGWLPDAIRTAGPVSAVAHKFAGLEKEFMPALDEGAYLYMPVTMPHASIGEVLDILQRQDRALRRIPEIDLAVGKLGRMESPLDPAPVSMIETLINYKPEYLLDDHGKRLTFKFNAREIDYFRDPAGQPLPGPDHQPYHVRGRFQRDAAGRLIPDPGGMPFRQWRPALDPQLNDQRPAWPGIHRPADIWQQILLAAELPGVTTAPQLQPISARLVMLQSGIRAAMGIRVKGPDIATIEGVTREIEKYLRELPFIDPLSVIADRIIGKPYLEIDINRRAIAQYGINLQQVQDVIEIAIGGKQIMATVEGRERYPVRVRYMRELRDHIDAIGRVLVPAPDGTQIPLVQLADIRYTPGPQMIKGEDAFIVGHVLFDRQGGYSESRVVAQAQSYLASRIETGELVLPAGVSYTFTGNYENQVRAEKKLQLILPLALLIIFMILSLQFKSVTTSSLVFSGVAVAWAGGFIMIWLYGQPWFLNFSLFGMSMRDLFQVQPLNLSVAVWVGFLALFGIATDDGVVMATYLEGTFSRRSPASVEDIRAATIEASLRRVRPCLMTTATTILALVPVLTSTGRGSDIMVPMAIPSFGGMLMEVITMLVVPVLYCGIKEHQLQKQRTPVAIAQPISS